MGSILIGPKCKLCRREGVKLFLKGSRCSTEKCAIFRRQKAPGQHGSRMFGRTSDYGVRLREKQKVKRIYGVSEAQFRNYYDDASRKKGVTGTYLLQTLEKRLDNVIYRLGLAKSRRHARKLITQGKFRLNDVKVDIPSILVSKGDVITLDSEKGVVLDKDIDIPVWLSWNAKKKEGKVKDLPKRENIDEEINEQLIVEFYSR